jgi:hypothetical protein
VLAEAVFVIDRPAALVLVTSTIAVALLVVRLGTIFPAEAVTVSAIFVPAGVALLVCRVSVKFATAFSAIAVVVEQVIVPVPPTAGSVGHVQPPVAGGVIDWNVVLGGVVCVKVTVPVVADGPSLVTLCV